MLIDTFLTEATITALAACVSATAPRRLSSCSVREDTAADDDGDNYPDDWVWSCAPRLQLQQGLAARPTAGGVWRAEWPTLQRGTTRVRVHVACVCAAAPAACVLLY